MKDPDILKFEMKHIFYIKKFGDDYSRPTIIYSEHVIKKTDILQIFKEIKELLK